MPKDDPEGYLSEYLKRRGSVGGAKALAAGEAAAADIKAAEKAKKKAKKAKKAAKKSNRAFTGVMGRFPGGRLRD